MTSRSINYAKVFNITRLELGAAVAPGVSNQEDLWLYKHYKELRDGKPFWEIGSD